MKVDMVYLWCDGEETEFKKRRQKYVEGSEADIANEEVIGDKRFFDNDELRYSLRSLEKNANWINHVYIVTDRQIPKWLNLDYEKVTIVDHYEIMPKEIIPCFNSTVIEYFIAFIPRLSEYFLYGNDDTFFGNKVIPGDFFVGDNPIVRVRRMKTQNENINRYSYINMITKSIDFINHFYGKQNYYVPHHNIDAYRKSIYIDTFYKYQDALTKCMSNKFRNLNDLHRVIFNLEMLYTCKADLMIVDDPKPWRRVLNSIFPVYWESYVDETSEKAFNEIKKYKPLLFCLNSNNNCNIEHKRKIVKFFEKLFPNPSKFEK